jgi:hypothetical protein
MGKITRDELDSSLQTEVDKIGILSSDITDLQSQKADITYVDNQLSTKRDKATKITNADLDISSDANKIKLVNLSDEVLQAMAGTTPVNVTPGPNSVTQEKIAPGAVTLDKIAEAVRGKNLFNKDTVTNNAYIVYDNGQIVTGHPTYCASDFIPVEPNTDYYFTKVLTKHYAFYDVNKNWIGPSTNGGASTGQVVRTPANAAYMRVTLYMTDVASAQIEKGTVGTSYEPYSYSMNYLLVKDVNIPKGTINSTHIQDKSIGISHLKDAILGKNLFNKNTVTPDKYVLYSNGQLGDNTDYVASDFIPVEPNTTYTRSYSHQMAFYDVNKTYISGINVDWSNTGVTTFTTPSNAAYIRVTVAKSALDTMQIEKGSVATSYEPYGFSFPDLQLPQIYGGLDVVLPRKMYALLGDTTNIQSTDIYFKNIVKGNMNLVNVDVDASYGRQYSDRWHLEAGNTSIPEYNVTSGNFDVTVKLRDMNMNVLKTAVTNVEIVSKTTPTTPVRLLCIGDSMTRPNTYAKQVQDILPNVKTVGTRTYDDGVSNGEGRGGWTVSNYLNNIGMSSGVDSPFLFPVGVPGSKYWGNTEQWKKICYTDPNGYDYQGFQKIAKGWTGTDFLFDTNGYPKNPSVEDVVIDPTKPAGSRFLKWDGSEWVVMNPQPTVEFNFAKYMERYASAFGVGAPTVVTILLGANDFQTTDGINGGIESYISGIKTIINSIKAYNSAIKVVINLPIIGNTQDIWATAKGTSGTAEMYRQNMQKVGRRILTEWDNDTQLANGIYVCAMNAVIDTAQNLADWVHPNSEGYKQIGNALAALIQKIR